MTHTMPLLLVLSALAGCLPTVPAVAEPEPPPASPTIVYVAPDQRAAACQRAIGVLLDQGAVRTHRGRGTFVQPLRLSTASFDLSPLRDILDDEAVTAKVIEARVVPAAGSNVTAFFGAATALKAELEAKLSPAEKLEALSVTDARAHAKAAASEKRAEARAKGYEGEACGECGNFTLVRNGTCMKCDTCGSTTGCS